MKNKQKQIEFKTDSLSLSSFLLCNSHMVKRIEPSLNIAGKYYFVFEQSSTLTDLVNQFNSYSAGVLPQKYYLAIRDIKRMLMEYRTVK